jgi:hypothetical protein
VDVDNDVALGLSLLLLLLVLLELLLLEFLQLSILSLEYEIFPIEVDPKWNSYDYGEYDDTNQRKCKNLLRLTDQVCLVH